MGGSPDGKSRYRMLGRYAISDEIAAGGMASVHLGRLVGPVAFTRTVAIKRMHEHLIDDEEMRARFLDEARLAARIRHPNVVPTLDVIAEQDEVFIVMEYVHGTSLGRLVSAAKEAGVNLPARVVATITAEALHGLHAAHEAKSDQGEPLMLVHRDISPQNVLIGADGTTRVVDFGIAKARVRKFETMDGKLRGKLKYMAPEQLRGGDVDRRTDVYAAGVVFWECLTGQRLYEGIGEVELVGRLATGMRAAPPSSVRVCATLTPEQSASADMIAVRALAAEPKDRFPSALAMAVAIENNLPLATRREVVEWLESLVGPAMAAWTKRVEAFEREPIDSTEREPPSRSRGKPPPTTVGWDDTVPVSDPAIAAPQSITHTSAPVLGVAPAPPQTTLPMVEPMSAPPLAPSLAPSHAPVRPARSRSIALVALLVTALVALGGVATAMALRGPAKQADASTAAPPSPSLPTTPATVGSVAMPATPPAPVDSGFPIEMSTGGKRSHGGRRHGPGGATPRNGDKPAPSETPPDAPARPPPDCDPPYTRDPSTGVIMHKPHCLGVQ